jgi:hypothetical protein
MMTADVVIVSDNLRCITNIIVILFSTTYGKACPNLGSRYQFSAKLASYVTSPIRIRLLKMVDFNIVYTKACLAPLISAGLNPNRILVSENNIDTSLAVGLHHKASRSKGIS